MRRERFSRLWLEFQNTFSDLAGISVQAFDDKGNAIQPSPDLPPLCVYLQRFPETSAACQKDCFKKATTCREARKILTARCYAGLSYRVIPIRRRGRPYMVILVGRVLSEVSGGEQYQGFVERYKLSRQSFLKSLAGVRSVSGSELERVAGFVRRLAFTFIATDARFRRHHTLLERRRGLIELARLAATFTDRGPGQARRMLESLGGVLGLPGVALLVREDGWSRVQASVGLGGEALLALERQDWQRVFEPQGNEGPRLLATREELLGAGIDLLDPPVVVQRLGLAHRPVGYLLATGKALSGSDLDLFEAASPFIAARITHERCRDLSAQQVEEARLLGVMSEKFLGAHGLEELLPLTLETAMRGLHAKRGSILLAGEEGRITAHALRGDHASISGTIRALHPGSVSHKVFFDRKPLLVRDVDQEPGLKRERQFPYASRSFVSVPLRQNGDTLGVLHLTEREGTQSFTAQDLALLERLSLQASGAIRKAQLEAEVQALRVTSSTDYLTGAHNRRFLEEQLGIEFQRSRRFGQSLAVAMIDIDGFKALNDEGGHEYGDRVLREVADAIRQQVRSVDILARYGGDEFVLLLPGTGAAGALTTLEKIRSRVSSIALGEDRSDAPRPTLSVSAGLAVYPDTVAAAEELLRRADEALYQAKKSGRNAVLLWSH